MVKTTTLSEIRKELEDKSNRELMEYCLRLARFKKENKELLSFLVFDANDVSSHIENVRNEIISSFDQINNTHVYYLKKSIRKILRQVNKHIRIIGERHAEAELLIQFCISLYAFPGNVVKHKQILKLYETNLGKAEKALSYLHPDLQYDLKKQLHADS
ncbi:MAG: hypothetical protein ABI683_11405 [Ginsengibacter sp.]